MLTKILKTCRTAAAKFCAAIILFSGLTIHFDSFAQVEFAVAKLQFEICLAQNWDTPTVQGWLGKVSKTKRMALYGASELSGTNKKCLMESKPFPQSACNQVLARYLDPNREKLTEQKHVDLFAHTDEEKWPRQCFSADDKSNDDWLPADVALSKEAQEILRLAASNNPAAQKKAIALYTESRLAPPDPRKADYWLRKLADNGDAEAQWQVGQNFRYGRKFYKTDYTQAAHYFSMSAKSGKLDAMRDLAEVYSYSDVEKSIYWYTKAAGLGDANSAYSLGKIYEEERYHKRDVKLALTWYAHAAKLNEPNAMWALANLLQKVAPNDMEKLREAHEWLRKADALGENGTTGYLEKYFPWPDHTESDQQKMTIQHQHAEQGDTNAQLAMAQRYFNAVGVDKDYAASLKWWTLAANAGDPIGQRMLGKAYLYGWGIPERKEFALAIQWLEKAAAQGDQEAMATIGFAYINTKSNSPKERKKYKKLAIQWIHRAAEHGYRPEDMLSRTALWAKE